MIQLPPRRVDQRRTQRAYEMTPARPWHCQVNRSQNELVPTSPMCGASSRLLDARLLLPDPKGFRPGAAITAGAEAVTPWPEMAVDDGVRREEILRLAG